MDLWNLAGGYLYGAGMDSLVTGGMLNPYTYLNPYQGLLTDGGTFAQYLGGYSQYYRNGMQSALKAIDSDPELKEKVTDTLSEVYKAMSLNSKGNSQVTAERSLTGSGEDGTSPSSAGISQEQSASGTGRRLTARRVQASSSYLEQMKNGRRTPTMHAPTHFI